MYQLVVTRLSESGAKIVLTLNKGSPFHWTKRELIDPLTSEDGIYLDSDLNQNPGISDQTKRFFNRTLFGHWKKRLLHNQWAAATGLVYPSAVVIPHVTEVPRRVECSVDYGIGTVTCAQWWGLFGDQWIAFDEYYWDSNEQGHQRTSGEHAQAIVNRRKCSKFIIDPTAAALKVDMRRLGAKVQNGKNDILLGVQACETSFQERKIAISEACSQLVIQVGQLVWDENAQLRGEDRPVKDEDHATDSMRYWVMSKYPPHGGLSVTQKPPGM